MGSATGIGFGIKIDKMWTGSWSFGICLSHLDKETYIYINLFKVSISIGIIEKYVGDNNG